MHVEQLQSYLQGIEAATQLLKPRVLRRVIRLDRRLQGFRLTIPHEHSYTIDRDRLLAFADLSELTILPSSDLPRRVILLPLPDDDELQNDANWPRIRDRDRRRLFHACVHLELEKHLIRGPWTDDWAQSRREQLGEVEFAEIREVLLKEDLLFQSPSDAEIYIEFAAVALELQFFAPEDLPFFFPAIRDWEAVAEVLRQDLDLTRLFQRFTASIRTDSPTPPQYAPALLWGNGEPSRTPAAEPTAPPPRTEPADTLERRYQSVRSRLRGPREMTPELRAEADAAAHRELARLSERLGQVLGLDAEQREQWRAALQPLLAPAADGFWSNEARLLHDLRKVCSEQERGVYKLDLVRWALSLGKRPIRRPLPLMQDALTLRYFRTVRRRIDVARLTPAERERLAALVDSVLPRIEGRSRDRLRDIINAVFDDVGFVPRNVLEIVARRKLVEELVDRIVERGYVTMAELRDAISRNDLKLPDVTTLSEVAFGTCLLRADRQFDTALDGVYRRGAVYLRWPQTLSSVVFGTNIGRFLTQHVIVPFGGAYLLLAFLWHTGEMFVGHEEETEHAVAATVADELAEPQLTATQGVFFSCVLLLGIWLSMLIHRPEFRAWNVAILSRAWLVVRRLAIDLPQILMNSPTVRRILASRTFAVLRSYVLEPALLAGLIYPAWLILGGDWNGRDLLELFLITALFLNSPVGRAVSERTVDFLVRAWQELKMYLFAAVVRWIMDAFDRFFTWLERVVYAVDELMRFRAGDNPATQGLKLAGGVVWFIVSYVVVFVFTLLVEPQINPIKHFPVVTVAHKLILPTGPMFVRILAPYVGGATANTLVWTTIWLIPGVFGFLVWELRENWRLYAANRSQKLGPTVIGDHGETMLRLLRPGIHSGTLPKAYAALRRAAQKGGAWEQNRVQRKRVAILHVEEAVRHFVERELIALLDVAELPVDCRLAVGTVHAATSRIDVQLLSADTREPALRLTWEWRGGQLIAEVEPHEWLERLPETDLRTVCVALSELLQRAGVDRVEGPLPLSVAPPVTRQESISYWSVGYNRVPSAAGTAS